MNNFSTMPLRFRAWDLELRRFVQYADFYDESSAPHKSDLEAIDLAMYLSRDISARHEAIISQDTGLKDKNGRSIYTGDIVRVCRNYGFGFLPRGSVGSIIFDPKELCVKISNNGQFRLTANKQVEVIGNIWEGPELLEDEDDGED